jgi:hypothetical protein
LGVTKKIGLGASVPGRIGRRAAALLVTAGLVSAGLGLIAGPAMALGPGRVCMFFAPSGANWLGHVGWAFEEGKKDNWIYGATENPDGNNHGPNPDKATTGSWSYSAPWWRVLSDFRANKDFHGAGYYQYYRCTNTGGSSVGAAIRMADATQYDGFDGVANNCLTKAVRIYRAYDGDPRILYLPDGSWTSPATYFWTGLNMSRSGTGGWESAAHL